MECIKCKNKIIIGKQFCGFCGAKNSTRILYNAPHRNILNDGPIARFIGIIFTLVAMGFIVMVLFNIPIGGVGYVNPPPWDPPTQTFSGYDCTGDCSGHEAGYDWAEDKGITDIDDCGGNSNSFIEGCQAYVEENY